MRTTVTLDDALYEEARRIAYETRRPLGTVINDWLAAGLREQQAGTVTRELGKLRGTISIAEDFDVTPDDVIDSLAADL